MEASDADFPGTPSRRPRLAELDGGEWGTVETSDKGELLAKLGLPERSLPPERTSLADDDAVV